MGSRSRTAWSVSSSMTARPAYALGSNGPVDPIRLCGTPGRPVIGGALVRSSVELMKLCQELWAGAEPRRMSVGQWCLEDAGELGRKPDFNPVEV